MPLDTFTDEAYAGLAAGREQVAIGMAQKAFDDFETKRQESFHGFVRMLNEGGKP